MTVPIIFCINDIGGKYWLNLAVAIESVLVNSAESHVIFVLHDETMNQEAKEAIVLIASSHKAKLNFIKLKLPEFFDDYDFGYFSHASIFRLAIPFIFKDYEQVVYLDADLIFHGVEINELIMTAPQSVICAVLDPYIGRSQKHRDQLQHLNLDASSYFNSGVLLMRPKQMDSNLINIFSVFLKENPALAHPDQDFLNFVFKDVWGKLDAKFNQQACTFDQSLFKPLSSYWGKVIHYAGRVKPLEGHIAPAFIPFWMYAKTPLILKTTQAFDFHPLSLLEPDKDNKDVVYANKYKR